MPSLTNDLGVARPSTTVMIDKERQIRYDWNAGCRFEEAYGRSIPDSMTVNIGVRLITHLVWAGLLHAEPGLQIRQVEKRIQTYIDNGGVIPDLSVSLVNALMESGILGKFTKDSEAQEESKA